MANDILLGAWESGWAMNMRVKMKINHGYVSASDEVVAVSSSGRCVCVCGCWRLSRRGCRETFVRRNPGDESQSKLSTKARHSGLRYWLHLTKHANSGLVP